jgi:hypothetical protein
MPRSIFRLLSDEEPPDFSKEDPVTTRNVSPPVPLDRTKWEAEARALSALFRQMTGIQTSSVGLGGSNSLTRYLTSEGISFYAPRTQHPVQCQRLVTMFLDS